MSWWDIDKPNAYWDKVDGVNAPMSAYSLTHRPDVVVCTTNRDSINPHKWAIVIGSNTMGYEETLKKALAEAERILKREEKLTRYWVVINIDHKDGGQLASKLFKHETFEAACAEADRLSNSNKGERFVVMEARSVVSRGEHKHLENK